MNEFTEEQLCLLVNKLSPIIGETKAQILTDELRPKPKFAKGQVVFLLHGHFGGTYHEADFVRGKPVRALTLTEMGPLVVKLVNAIADAGSADTPTPIYSAWKELINIHGRSK